MLKQARGERETGAAAGDKRWGLLRRRHGGGTRTPTLWGAPGQSLWPPQGCWSQPGGAAAPCHQPCSSTLTPGPSSAPPSAPLRVPKKGRGHNAPCWCHRWGGKPQPRAPAEHPMSQVAAGAGAEKRGAPAATPKMVTHLTPRGLGAPKGWGCLCPWEFGTPQGCVSAPGPPGLCSAPGSDPAAAPVSPPDPIHGWGGSRTPSGGHSWGLSTATTRPRPRSLTSTSTREQDRALG